MADYRRAIHGWAAPARGNINAQAPEKPSAHHGAPPAVNPRRVLNEGRSVGSGVMEYKPRRGSIRPGVCARLAPNSGQVVLKVSRSDSPVRILYASLAAPERWRREPYAARYSPPAGRKKMKDAAALPPRTFCPQREVGLLGALSRRECPLLHYLGYEARGCLQRYAVYALART